MIKLFHNGESFATDAGLITPHNKKLFWAFGLVAGSWLICLTISGVIWLVDRRVGTQPAPMTQIEPLHQFASESEFRSYFNEASAGRGYGDSMLFGAPAMMRAQTDTVPAELPASNTVAPERVSETNVQIKGIDEPDMVKTDGTHIFVSDQQSYFVQPPMMRADIATTPGIMPPQPIAEPKTQILNALPIETAKKISDVSQHGDLLVSGSMLLVLGSNTITGFDISDPTAPKEAWHYTLAGNQQIASARLVDQKLVVIADLAVYAGVPCPMPLFSEVSGSAIRCSDIWHPIEAIDANATYTVLKLDPVRGDVESQVSFAGTGGQTVVYVSPDAVYVTFVSMVDWGEITAEFLGDPANTLVDDSIKLKLKHVMQLDISDAAKQVEVEHILAIHTSSMSDNERMKWETERNNQMTAYVDAHKRDLEHTTIAKVRLNDFGMAGLGQVPGHPLNQFSLDEYQHNLRIATTVGGRGVGGSAASANDVYVLGSDMNIAGRVTDLGKEERIYAVRFMGDKGYVVTYRETDPLYVLDLSQASSPKVSGDLKIPGFSSYLHPLEDTLLLGVGKENNTVKLSLFDVANPQSPQEISTYKLTDYWSEIQNTHHAFLQDEKHTIFFLPAEKGGYIFGYTNNELTLVKTVEGRGILRALYINDYLYLVGNRKIIIVSENNWQTVKTVEW